MCVNAFALGIGNYVVYLQTGYVPLRDLIDRGLPSLGVPDGLKQELGKLVQDARRMGADVGSEKPIAVKVYKWTDAKGVVHYGEQPAGTNAEEVIINPNRNLLPAEPEPGSSAAAAGGPDAQTPIEKARAAAELMKARIENQESY
ncbi:hypothetical protein CJA_1024 [Cellvibrio japonicus Ueda107]|uniref:DUF4124 domain-containing protein n=1 Tax=Cellvibrio japonicus (strain Ueda107) TaxID=498211 RepID=B3PB52_CELJU|nr:hypothetical protein CJA_1024 [Cellvibrio japonicus Ueda107]QEI11642.1 DUF4124 domain-containing protein [Cellvibrio japonicus]QEI15216.1 DUF4124 domain-containing protein [Cellvibrio japonicus]QEI18796.1 DUF4124 domain-containing protein [Cellvibrio japonicus]